MKAKKEETNEPKMPFELFGIECGPGWNRLVYPILAEVDLYNRTHTEGKATITQIKEKYGTLNINGFFPDKIQKMVDKAENKSEKTCEECGSTKHIGHTVGYITTICKECAIKKEKISIWKKNKLEIRLFFINLKYKIAYQKRIRLEDIIDKIKSIFD